jgi:hypothetical protein
MTRTQTWVVPQYWLEGTPAANNGAQFWTDGVKLYSYNLQIGDTTGGVKVLRDYTKNGKHGFKSMTTSKHVGYARKVADIVD